MEDLTPGGFSQVSHLNSTSPKRVSRSVEWKLLLMAGVYAMVGALALYLGGSADRMAVLACLISIGAFYIVTLYWFFVRYRGDYFILPIIALLASTGLVFLFRLNPVYGERQFIWLLIGLAALLLVTRFFIDFRFLSDYKYIYALVGIVALILPIFFGNEQGGAKSWISLGFFNLQPSEFVKILVVLFLASYLSENRTILTAESRRRGVLPLPELREWGPLLVMLGISLLMLVFQNDLGAALIYFSTFLAMLYVATSRLSYIFAGMTMFAAGVYFSYHVLTHVQARVSIWLDPWATIDTSGYQIVQSLFAINAGGMLGSGLGLGYPYYIPAVHTDLIFSAICEEMGFAGGVCIILLYLILVYRGIRIALSSRDEFAAMAAFGLTALLGLQTFIIIAGVTKFLPLTGITLPFISYGGSSLVANFVLIGLLLNISHEEKTVL